MTVNTITIEVTDGVGIVYISYENEESERYLGEVSTRGLAIIAADLDKEFGIPVDIIVEDS